MQTTTKMYVPVPIKKYVKGYAAKHDRSFSTAFMRLYSIGNIGMKELDSFRTDVEKMERKTLDNDKKLIYQKLTEIVNNGEFSGLIINDIPREISSLSVDSEKYRQIKKTCARKGESLNAYIIMRVFLGICILHARNMLVQSTEKSLTNENGRIGVEIDHIIEDQKHARHFSDKIINIVDAENRKEFESAGRIFVKNLGKMEVVKN